MKKIISLFMIFIILFCISFSAFSFNIDGVDNGVEWDGASFYKLIEGESNCGVNFGLVKVKFDYDTSAVCLCFHFIDPELTSDNNSAGVLLKVNDSVSFEITASDAAYSENHDPYSFDGAIHIDENNGATCEIRVGIKPGLPESIDFDARFIDSHCFYSDYYNFIVINELYETTEPDVVHPTADNTDPLYNPEVIVVPTERTTRIRTTKSTTQKKTTTKKSTTKRATTKTSTQAPIINNYNAETEDIEYSYRKSTKAKKTEKTTFKTTKAVKTEKAWEKIYIYEKEVYISEIYVTQSAVPSTTVAVTTVTESDSASETSALLPSVSLSKGTKYKKIIAAICLISFIVIACFGTYSAKKSKIHSENKE